MVRLPSSNTKVAIAEVLWKEGYITSFNVLRDIETKPELEIELKYFKGNPVIERISRVSRPGLRTYKPKNELPKVLGGLGIAIISTPCGVMSDRQARKSGHGGEVLCIVE